jgi:outer membrane protein TolC
MTYTRNKIYLLMLLVLALTQVGAQSLSVQDVLTLAQTNNPELKAVRLEIEKATQQKVVARSMLLPQVSASGVVNHYFQLPAFFGFGESPGDSKIPFGRFGGEDQTTAFLSVYQPLFNPAAFPTLHRSQLLLEQSMMAARSKEIDILSQIKANYLEIVILNERIKLINESISRNKRALQDSKSLFLQGKGLRVDTLRAYTSVKNLEPDLVRLTFAAKTARLELKAVMGVDSLEDFTLSDSLVAPSPQTIADEESVYQQVIGNNPEYQLLKLQELADKQQIKVASAYRLPVVSLAGQYQIQSQTNNMEYRNAYYPTSSFVGLQVSVPLFTGFSTTAKIRHASLSKQQSTLLVRNKERQLQAQVHQSLANIRESALRLENTAVVQETAELSYNIIQYRYKNGIASRIELTDAELALSTAQSNYLEAIYDYIAATIELNKITGSVN